MDKKEKFIRDRLLVYLKKNKDYSNSFDKSLDRFGEVAYEVRAYDKVNRFKQLIDNDNEVKDESIRDTLLDLFSYSIMFEMWKEENTVRKFIETCINFMADDFKVFLLKINYLVDGIDYNSTLQKMRELLLNELG